ncbi:TonB-dependent receptor [Gracilimonas amylolytica]|uniref:TonB-dependent receptor n=1 Tax=Gracilimonas amylolytica TaxID=1749045 RepID=UPI000CD8ABE9|nr:TonB-dependent receptor [Gracilimonas amylolytica]
MKHLILIIGLLFTGAEALMAQQISVKVADMTTKEPIVQAHIKDGPNSVITVTDVNGMFTVDLSKYSHLTITAVGYAPKNIHLQRGMEVIYLNPEVFRDQTELLVLANEEGEQNVHAYHNRTADQGMDQFLDNIDGVSTTKRGAFGWEPAVRGQSDQRMNLVIDGMQVFKACVDKMDPITSYVETNNLSKLQIDKSGSGVAQNGTGVSTVNLVTQKAESAPTSFNFSTSYRAPDQYRTVSLSGNTSDASGRNAVRFSGSYKKADDFRAGNDRTIQNTQYEKLNLNVNYRHTFPSQHSLEAGYIMDKAYDIGYPALLMDATKALADIGQIRFNFAPSNNDFQFNTAQVYANGVRHWMDDYGRDVANRQVMRGMYMPMYGTTTTYGAKLNGAATLFDHQFDWFMDAYMSDAFGDMLMESLDPSIQDMLIYNLDEVKTNNASLGFRHRIQLSDNVLMKIEESIRYKTLRTDSESHASFFQGLYGEAPGTRAKFLLSGSGSVLWMMNNNWSLSGSLVYSERMGNHMELFGHYIYNYTDGFFYDGNPWLKTERSINTDINATWETTGHSLSFTLFHKQYFNYIDGVLGTDSGSNDFRFKQYANVGDAVITGGEFRSFNDLGMMITLENRLSYLYAHNQTLDEPLPLMPPLKGNTTLHFHRGRNMFMADLEWAAEQNRIAEISSIEDQTGAYGIFNLTFERRWMDGDLTSIVSLNNILDHYYHTHTSIGNIPEAGRNLMISLSYQF